jgi:hypothetical protein
VKTAAVRLVSLKVTVPLKPPAEAGGAHVLTDAGFQVNVKTSKPAEG